MNKRVLIFDDDADILEVCSIVLENSGFIVATANHCNQILDKLKEFGPDLILMDNKIPPLGGVKASREIKTSSEYGKLPLVFFSANQDVAKLAEEAGADYFIEKPCDLDKLVSLIRSSCG